MVDRTLLARENAIHLLKFNLKKAQDRMKSLANKGRTDRQFDEGDWVYLKLQPYRQNTVRQGTYHKLGAKFFGPFQVAARIGQVAYKLHLPANAAIHPVFHVSQLKKCHAIEQRMGILPQCSDNGDLLVEPAAVLERKLGRIGNTPVTYLLIQWTNHGVEDATWELYHDLIARFPNFVVDS